MSTVVVIGDTHNAWVTAYCLAKLGHKVTLATDDFPKLKECSSEDLKLHGVDLVRRNPMDKEFDYAWIAHDTPLDATGAPDVLPLYSMLSLGQKLSPKFILSSQVPLGFCRELDEYRPLAYVPENMRIGDGVHGFLIPDRLVIGAEPIEFAAKVEKLMPPYRERSVFHCSLETAEMIKHATNAFLATSISLANELAEIGKTFKVDMDVVTKALRADSRIGPKAYVESGRPFTGHTLKRDLRALQIVADWYHVRSPLIDAVLEINERT